MNRFAYTINMMFKMKDNLYDLLIIGVFIIWGIWLLWIPCSPYWSNVIYALGGLVFVLLFFQCNRTTKEIHAQIRRASIKYAFTSMIGFLCGLKITEVLCDRVLAVEPLGVLFIGIFLQSCYFLIKNKTLHKSA